MAWLSTLIFAYIDWVHIAIKPLDTIFAKLLNYYGNNQKTGRLLPGVAMFHVFYSYLMKRMRTDSQFVRDTSPRDLAYEMRPPHAYHWAQWCVRITREYDIGVGLTFLRDDFPLWYARAVDTSPAAWPRVWDARHIPAWPRVWDATAARVSLGAARPIPIMTSRERHITRLTSLSNITTVAYTASRVRWERFRVYFCRAYKLFVETFCFVANANIITTVAYTASRVHIALGTILCIF